MFKARLLLRLSFLFTPSNAFYEKCITGNKACLNGEQSKNGNGNNQIFAGLALIGPHIPLVEAPFAGHSTV